MAVPSLEVEGMPRKRRVVRVTGVCPHDGWQYQATFKPGRYVIARTIEQLVESKVVDFWTAVRAAIQYRRWARGLIC